MPHASTAVSAAIAALLASLHSSASAQASASPPGSDPPAPAAVLEPVVIRASADASAGGLTKPYAGGQVARGGRAGLFGNLDMMDAPFSSLNFTNDLIQNQQARSVADVLLNDPAVRNARGFGNFQEVYFIRGFLIYSDDMAYNGLYGLLPRQYVGSELLERVEVLRGTNSFLNGAAPNDSGIGGSINLLPKRAPAQPLSQVTAGVESGGQPYLAIDLARRFGPGNSTGLRINAAARDGDTAVDREGRELGLFAIGLDHRGSSFRLSADIGHQDHRLDAPRPNVSVAAGAVPTAPDADKNYAQPWTFSNERQTFGTLRGEWDVSSSVTAWAAAGAREGHERNRLAGPTASADGSFLTYRFDNDRTDRVKTGELGVRGKLATGSVAHELSGVLSAFSLDSRNAYGFSAFNALASDLYQPVDVAMPDLAFLGGDLDHPLTTRKVHTASVALADSMALLDGRLRLMLGARQQTIKETTYDYTSGASNGDYDKSKVTPMLGVVYKVTPQISTYASYAEALNKGATIPIQNQPSLYSKPFVSKQVEVGAKFDAGRYGATVSLFDVRKPTYAVDVAARTVTENGERTHRGLETSVYGQPAAGVTLLGGLTWVDAKISSSTDATIDGRTAIGVPKTYGNVGVEWDVPGVPGLTLGARALYTARQYVDNANTQQIPAWTRYDLSARYALEIAGRLVSVRAKVDNLANKNYWASAGGYPDIGYVVLGQPRTVTLSASVEF